MPSPFVDPLSHAPHRTVVLATGGTIAGTAARPDDSIGYTAGQVPVEALLAAVPPLAQWPIDHEQVAQLDSKDMDVDVWRRLAGRVAHHLARPEVAGIVITHGTDTLEETAYLLQAVLAPPKPVVLTAAMRPSTALLPDGPQNLLDAVLLARQPGARGVLAVVAGVVHGAFDVRKTHTFALDAFGSGDAGPIARISDARLQQLRPWPEGTPLGLDLLAARWPAVELVTSHAGASGLVVDALLERGVDGLVAVGTGNASLHHALEAALLRAQERGVEVRVATRVANGPVLVPLGADPRHGARLQRSTCATPTQARLALALELMQRRRTAG